MPGTKSQSTLKLNLTINICEELGHQTGRARQGCFCKTNKQVYGSIKMTNTQQQTEAVTQKV